MHVAEYKIADTYEKNGFALAKGVFDDSDLEPFRQVLGRGVDAFARKLHAAETLADLHEHLPFDRRLAAMFEGRELRMRSWDDIAFSPELFHLIAHPRLLDRVEAILGPEILFTGGYHVRPKMPESTLTAFPWHQDSQYYGEPTKHMHIISVTVPLVDLTEENGCLWMIAGSQRWGYLPGSRDADENMHTAEDVEARSRAIPIPMHCGDVMLFSNLTFHASKLNHTNRVRWTLDMRYASTRAARQQQGMSDDERAGYDFFLPRLRATGRRPAIVRSQTGPTTTCEEWLDVERPSVASM